MKKQFYILFFSEKIKKYIFLSVFLAFSFSLYSQNTIVTKLDSVNACPGDSVLIALNVDRFYNVSAISLVFNFDHNNLTFIRYQNLAPGLVGSFFLNVFSTGTNQQVRISWWDPVGSLNLGTSVLMEFVFYYIGGDTPLTWSTIPLEIEYNDHFANILPARFIDGCVYSVPPVDLGKDTTICLYNTVTLYAGNPGSSYLWSTNETTDSIVCSAISDTVITYYVNVTDSIGCNSTDSITVTFDPCVSIEDIKIIDRITIFPNPTNNVVFISNKDGVIINEVNIYNQIGQKVVQESKLTDVIEISKLKQGVYIIEIVSDEFIKREKLIIE
ncbi:MAG: T9SS type A sorting domain-containing protein [Bacteroidales bacterium]|nr:T9SS type A sorting domain-containing protein [Bacteroidales bacterium]